MGNTYKPRLTKPEKGNPYYNTKANGGYSNAIKGKPTDPDCDVLANCVGYAYGRFNEIGGYGSCKYLAPVNAENFIQYAGDLEVGQTPRVGACMVWRKGNTLSNSDGAGHVAIVEKVVSNTEVLTSESGWNSKAFWTKTRKKGNGNWGAGAAYTFLGFIYNPAPCCKTGEPTEADLLVDGRWGKDTTARLQQIFGTPIDGEVSNQWAKYEADNPGLVSGWDWQEKPNGKGSPLIRAMQKWAGMATEDQDGEIGPKTIKALQTKFGTTVDGVIDEPSQLVYAIQKWSNNQ